MRKLSFPVLAASRFYFRLNYNGRHSRLHSEPGKAFCSSGLDFFLYFPKMFLFSVKLQKGTFAIISRSLYALYFDILS